MSGPYLGSDEPCCEVTCDACTEEDRLAWYESRDPAELVKIHDKWWGRP
jgi:hypothetical protein